MPARRYSRPGRDGELKCEGDRPHIVIGPPDAPLIRRAIVNTTLPNCIRVTQGALTSPVVLESTKWEDWKVQH
jgi:hypothetical protein